MKNISFWFFLEQRVQLSGRWIYSLIKVDGWGFLRLLTFEGVVFIPNYSNLHGSPPFPFLWPGAAWDAHFEQTGALFRWGRGILKYFSPKFGELCSPDMETFGPFGEIFGRREIHRSNETNPKNPRHPSPAQTGSFEETQSSTEHRLHDETMVKMEYNQGICPFLLYFSTFCGWHPVFWISPNNPLLLTK